MNLPAAPPVDLRNLAAIDTIEPTKALVVRKAKSRGRLVATGLGFLAATGVLGWRMVTAELAGRAARRNALLFAAAGIGAAALFARWQLQRYFTASPPYEVELGGGRFEIRRYPSLQIAETRVDATWSEALDEGFRRLAGFIFGANVAHEKLSMTTPVLGTGDEEGYRLSFVLPDDVLVPTPNDARVELKNVPARRVAALRFHGRYSAENLEAHKRLLARALAEHNLKPVGEAMFAGYDPPSTIPALRRTELWVEVT